MSLQSTGDRPILFPLSVPLAAVATFWLVVGAVPSLLGEQSRVPMLAFLTAGVIWALLLYLTKVQAHVRHRGSTAATFLYCALTTWFVFVLVRTIPTSPSPGTNSNVALMLFAVAAFAGSTFLRPLAPRSKQRLFNAVLWSVPLYIAFNVAALELTGGRVTLLSSLFGGPRLSNLVSISGSNTIAAVASVAVISSAFLAHSRRQWGRVLPVALLILSSSVLIASGARGPAFCTVIVLALLWKLKTTTLSKIVKTLVLVSLISAPLTLFSFWLFDAAGLGDLLLRQGGEQFGFGTGRPLIWDVSIATLGDLSKLDQHLLGYGFGSSAQSGAQSAFYLLFGYESFARAEVLYPSLHNLTLQTIYDFGYVGLLVLTVTLYRIASRCGRIPDTISRYTLSVIALILTTGFTEPVGTMYNIDLFLFMFVVLAMGSHQAFEAPSSALAPDRWEGAGITPPADHRRTA